MQAEKLVTSRELSQKLEKLGVKQESLFQWVLRFNDEWQLWDEGTRSEYETGKEKEFVSAFTVTELADILEKLDAGEAMSLYFVEELHPMNDPTFAAADPEVWGEALVQLVENKTITL